MFIKKGGVTLLVSYDHSAGASGVSSTHQHTRHAVAAVVVGAAHVGASDLGDGLAADDVVVLRFGSAVTSGHE
jgi:hypothetical protein